MGSTKASKCFADRLSDLLADARERGEDYKTIAEATGVSTGALSNYASDKQQAGLSAVCALADYFDVSTDYLLGRTSEPKMHKSAADDLRLSPASLQNLKNLSDYENRYGIRGALNRMLSADGLLDLMVSIDRIIKIVRKEWLNASNYQARTEETKELDLSGPKAMLREEVENYYSAREKFKGCVPETRYFHLVNNREFAYMELELVVERFRVYLQEATGFRDLQELLYGNPNLHFFDTRYNYPIPNDSYFMADYDPEE